MDEQRNLMLAIALTLLLLVGFQIYMAETAPPPEQRTAADTAQDGETAIPRPEGADIPQPSQDVQVSRAEALAQDTRIPIKTVAVEGSVRLKGGRIDDLRLLRYKDSLDKNADVVTLLSPSGSPNPYFTEFGWSAAGNGIALPSNQTRWKAEGTELSLGTPLTLSWDNGQGLTFTRTYEIDENYLITVRQAVQNNSGEAVSISPYGLVNRTGTPETLGFYILHEGPIGVVGGSLQEIDYDDLRDDGAITGESTGGWLGITDKYWLTALIPAQDETISTQFMHRKVGRDRYQVSYLAPMRTIQPGESVENVSHLFAGAKKVDLIDGYEEQLGVERFNRAIDWGWFFFLTKPIFWLLDIIAGFVGNFGVAILALTVLIKLAFFNLANKSYVALSRMRKLQPKMKELREKYADDKQAQQQELMKLYKEEKINPLAGCLPILIQIPVFFALYKVLFVSIEMRHAPFFGWVQDLSAPDPLLITTLFGLIPWDPPGFLAIGLWPLFMGLSMWGQQRLNPQPADPIQAKVFMVLPVLFTFLLASFPVGLVIYWTWNNILTIAQQWVIMKRQGALD